METWLTYSPQDFLPFSSRVYDRLFTLHNAALWPAQIPALLGGMAIVILLLRRPPWSGRVLAVLLAVAWTVCALTFLPRYAAINWAASDLIPVFLAQAALLLVLGLRSRALEPTSEGTVRWAAVGLVVYGLVAYPVLAVLSGRPATGADVVALMPDPTAIVTIGVLLASAVRWSTLVLMTVPLLWAALSWATVATLGSQLAWAFAPVAGAILICAVRRESES